MRASRSGGFEPAPRTASLRGDELPLAVGSFIRRNGVGPDDTRDLQGTGHQVAGKESLPDNVLFQRKR